MSQHTNQTSDAEEEIQIEKPPIEDNIPQEPPPIHLEKPDSIPTKPERIEVGKDKRIMRTAIALIAIVILLGIVSISAYFSQDQLLSSLTIENGDLENQINIKQFQLNDSYSRLNKNIEELQQLNISIDENTSCLQSLQSGDIYHLHDPTYNETKEFMEKNKGTNQHDIIENAKKQGIRCAFVEVGLNTSYCYHPVGFETVDKGVIYFEPLTNYRVFLEVGKRYSDCVEGNPYLPSSDRITQIVIIW